MVVIFVAIVLNHSANRTAVDTLPESGQYASNNESLTQSDDSKSPPGETPLEQVVKIIEPPEFDVCRINQHNDVVCAGQAEPGSKVTVFTNGRPIGTVIADKHGKWVLLPQEQLEYGSHEFTVTQKVGDDEPVVSDSAFILVVPEKGKDIAGRQVSRESQPLALKVPRNKIGTSKVLQVPSVSGIKSPPKLSISVDVIDYDAQGNLSLAGRGKANAEVLVYLNNKLLGRSVVDMSGNWEIIPGSQVEPGLYRLRADQRIDGKVVARVELPFSWSAAISEPDAEFVVVVQPGNSLWRIARRTLGRGMAFTTIYEANSDQIRDPDLIYPGQVLSVPNVK